MSGQRLDAPPQFLPFPGKPKYEWTFWLRMFENYILAVYSNNLPLQRKKAQLLHCLGAEGQRIFYELPDDSSLYNASDNDYVKATKILENHFRPREHFLVARKRFHDRLQRTGESVDDFVIGLRELATHCKFPSTEDAIRDQFVAGTSVPNITEKLLQTRNQDLTLPDVLAFARDVEQARADARAVSHASKSESVHFVRRTEPSTSTAAASGRSARYCFRCGDTSHLANFPDCPAVKQRCKKCRKIGHLDSVCKSSQSSAVNLLDDSSHTTQAADNHAAADEVMVLNLSSQDSKAIYVPVNIDEIVVDLLVDTGSPRTLLNYDFYLKYFAAKHSLDSPSVPLVSYAGDKIPIVGSFWATVTYNDLSTKVCINVSEKGVSLLGRDVINALQIISINNVSEDDSINCVPPDLLATFSELFSPGVGKIKGFVHRLHVRANAIPIQVKPRRLPFSIRSAVSDEIKRLEMEGIIEPINSSEWISPLTVAWKKSGKIRLCTDLREVNKALIVDAHLLPKIDELLTELQGAQYFAKIDLASAYHQLELTPDCRNLTAFVTPDNGLYRYTRVCFGLASAPAAFQKMMTQYVTKGLDGVYVYLDDCVVAGKTYAEYRERLHKFLQRLKDLNMKLNDKCEFDVQEITFLGHVISPSGLAPSPQLTKAIVEAPRPNDRTTLQSYLGMIGYVSKFCPNLATVVEPLRALLRGEAEFIWTDEVDNAFNETKQMVANYISLALFDSTLPTIVTCDSSSYGIAASMSQMHGSTERIVACISRTLSPAERKYSVGEKEALACVWACERLHTYLWGRKFILRTDHRSLTTLLTSKGQGRASMRIARWNTRLMLYDYDIEYKPGAENHVADCFSRLPLPDIEIDNTQDEIILCLHAVDELSVNLQEFQTNTENDELIQQVMEYVQNGWPIKATLLDDNLRPYYLIRDELATLHGVLMKNDRVVVPTEIRGKLLRLAHATHPGMVRTKQRLRPFYWWPNMDRQVEEMVRGCIICQSSDKSAKTYNAPLQPVARPSDPWKKVAIDIVGPMDYLPAHCRFAFTLVDYYSRWPEVGFSSDISTSAVIKFLSTIFSREGYPQELISDHGVQFTSHEFEEFLLARNIKHSYSAIYHPAANGLCERFNKSFKEAIQVSKNSGRETKSALLEFLATYRSTQHATTGVSPKELFHGRSMHVGLSIPELHNPQTKSAEDVNRRVTAAQVSAKMYTDKKRAAKLMDLEIGESVRVKRPGLQRKGTNSFLGPFTVTHKIGPATYKLSDGKTWNQERLVRYRAAPGYIQ